MRPPRSRSLAIVVALGVVAAVAVAPDPAVGRSDLTRAQRVELVGLKRDAVRIGGLLRRGQTEEAKTMLAEVEGRFAELKEAAGGLEGERYAELIEEDLAEARSALEPGAAAEEEAHPNMAEMLADDAETPATAMNRPEQAMADASNGGGAGGITFSKDVAPTLVNSCGRCHMNGQSRGGFSMNSYQELMESGYVDPDDPEGGRMIRLMGQVEQPKMPPGNARIKRSQWTNARAWAVAGAKLDKGDPAAPMRLLVPTEAQLLRAAMAKMSDEELAASRLERANELFKKALRRSTPTVVEVSAAESPATGGLILIGNVDESRLEQIAGWIKEDAARLAPLAGEDGLGGRGPLTVFVMKSRFDYQEFHAAAHGLFEVPPSVTADATVPADGSDAYIALQDLRDDATRDDPGMHANVIFGLAEAAMKGRDGDVPAWLSAGLGPAIAFEVDPQNPALRAMAERLPAAFSRLSKPEDLLKPGTFAPEEMPAVGAALVSVLRKNGGDRKLGQLLDAMAASAPAEQPAMMNNMRRGGNRDRGDGGAAALWQVYGVAPAQLAAWLAAAAR
ncbi:c-type cytochrome domain-containing protein [Alienimonas sp. DA493]|uniref:c-type cytochrome domain-containing protein n=1 Tax=Alienimonas sp. DA493 TaxID=3373605 RepID=UPI003754E875